MLSLWRGGKWRPLFPEESEDFNTVLCLRDILVKRMRNTLMAWQAPCWALQEEPQE